MCGIAGFNWQDENLVTKMSERQAHRGPDASGVFVDEDISLGHRRLSIIDLSDKASQPMEYKDLVISYNGEIYNYQELKKELVSQGYKFNSGSDTEVILAAYDKWGTESFKKLNGIFALAIWDKKFKELVLARDHLGVKPLYYYIDSSTSSGQVRFLFASEIKALLEYDLKREVNVKSLNFLMRVLYIPEPETMFMGIKKLRSGHFAVIKNGEFIEKKYWDVENFENAKQSVGELKENINNLLRDSVKQQLISDRPLGVFLSGGWDSSTILGLMREQGVKDIMTFSSGFEIDNEKYNQDLNLARKTAEYYKTNHHEIKLASSEVLDTLEKAIYHLDEPNASPTIVPMYHLAQVTKKEVAVVLGGDGGDELFAGYPRYINSYYLNKLQKLPKLIRESLIPYKFLEKLLNKKELRRKLNTEAGYDRFAMFKVFPEDVIGSVLKSGLFNESVVPDYFKNNYFNQEYYEDFEKSLMFMELHNWLTVESLWKTDRMTMASGLEARVPLLDHRLVELAFQIPTSLKVKNRAGKWIFKEVVKQYVPEHLHHVKKRGWLTPGRLWLNNELKCMMQSIIAGEYCPEIRDYFDLDHVQKLYQKHKTGDSTNMNQLWVILTFAVWYNKFFSKNS